MFREVNVIAVENTLVPEFSERFKHSDRTCQLVMLLECLPYLVGTRLVAVFILFRNMDILATVN